MNTGNVECIIKAYNIGLLEGSSTTASVYINIYDEEKQGEEYYAFDIGYKESFYGEG